MALQNDSHTVAAEALSNGADVEIRQAEFENGTFATIKVLPGS